MEPCPVVTLESNEKIASKSVKAQYLNIVDRGKSNNAFLNKTQVMGLIPSEMGGISKQTYRAHSSFRSTGTYKALCRARFRSLKKYV